MTSSSVKEATQFLIGRIADQAKRESVELTPLEILMLGFAEASASAEDLEAAAKFDRESEVESYEKRVAHLIQNAYRLDKDRGYEAAWESALAAVAEEDIYLNVMIEQAQIGERLPFLFDWKFLVGGFLPIGVLFTAGVLIAFTPIGAMLIRNDFLRFVLFLVLVLAPLAIAKSGRNGSV
jgi:hypothetical protein